MFNRDDSNRKRISQFRRLNAGTAIKALAVAIVLLFATTNAHADYVSLLTDGATQTIGGAIYTQGPVGSGTGVFPAFVRLQGAGAGDTVEGYNTTVNGTFDNTSDDTHNHEILLSDVPIVIANGVEYYQFFLDINETSGGNPPDQYLSLDEVKIFTSATPNQGTETLPLNLGTLVYSLDDMGGTVDGVLLDYDLEAGSGFADMTLLVPKALFTGGPYVYLYSEFGALGEVTSPVTGDFGYSDGFEEWAIGPAGQPPQVIPEPSTYALYALGISMLFASGWYQKRRKALSFPTL